MGKQSGLSLVRLRLPALILLLLVLALTILLYLADISRAYDPPYLLFSLNLIFVAFSSLIVAFMAARSFTRSGSWPVIWLGSGALAFGLTMAISSGMLCWMPDSPNQALTMHNIGALFTASLHFVGAFFALNQISPRESGQPFIVLQLYAATSAVIVLITIVSTWELLPVFFAQGSGGTPIRQLVVTIAVLLFFISGGGFLWRWRKQNSDVLYWYALGLMLMALGMIGLWMQAAMGTPLNWAGRGSLMLGALYLLAAVLVSIREARLRQVPAPEALAMLFGQQANLKLLFDSVGDAIVATDAGFCITGWNRAAEKIYGWKTSEVAGKYLWEVLNSRNPDGTPFVSGENIPAECMHDREVIHTRKDGKDLSVLATANTFRDRKGRIEGTVSIFHDNTERKQAEVELQLHRKNLEDLVAERTRELRRLSHRLVDAQEKERVTIGNELHDEIGQYLTYATLLISRAVRDPKPELLTESKSVVQEALAKIRVLSSLLSPRLLNSAGLQMALSSLTEDYTRHTGMKVNFSHSDQLEDVNQEAALAIYRITQESLTNVARHAEASEVKVTVSRLPGSVRLEVIDNGKGFDVKDKKHTTGLTGMRERAVALGGTLVIDSNPGQGTSIRAEIPVPADSNPTCR